jgi:hypothetical protein
MQLEIAEAGPTRFPDLAAKAPTAAHYLNLAHDYEERAGRAMRAGRREEYDGLHALAQTAWRDYHATLAQADAAQSH